jgi:putative tryptophan/tyrosine transport system substrate-binding protein
VRRPTTWMVVTLVLAIVAGPVAAAQPPGKVPRIAYVMGRSRISGFDEAFRQGLRELGYIEGENITVEYRFAGGEEGQLQQLMDEAVRLKPDIIVTGSTPSIQAARNATHTIPIVMAISQDPVRDGLVASLARPGGNVTGLSVLAPELTGKRLELLREIVPAVTRVAVIWNTGNPGNPALFGDTEAAARALGLQLHSLGVRSPADFPGAFAAATRSRATALATLSDAFMVSNRLHIAELAVRHRLPAVAPNRVYVEAGILMSYGPDLAATHRRAATYVHKILTGAKPADLPVEQPMTFELLINLKTARALGLTMPQSVLVRADKVIQ